jgi:carbonic anhydrase
MLWQPAHTQAAADQSAGERNLIEGNQAYVESFTQGHLALPPSQKYAICTLRTTTTALLDRSD